MHFLDTNVLLYSLEDPAQSEKSRAASAILAQRDWRISVQVLQEFYYQATRTTRPGRIPHEEAAFLVARFCHLPVQPLTSDICLAAIATHQRYQISYWDAAIVEAARVLGCHTILSEDLQPGQNFGGVRVVNPFIRYGH